ncbi:DNA polymerase III subunit beta [Thalassoglobus neptunius]|uniref:Beta sliding clamp n=2 Tax=Thalassoglobus neptunius TaxID=1938619 RepID=A0A5C5X3Q3_9PLAN|nr:DNA polymerase III subunit beta [Thalassoglobus neptunius]
MKVKINTNAITKALAKCFSVTPARTPKDVLKYVRLAATEGCVSVHATDTEVSLTIDITPDDCYPVECPSPGTVLLPVKVHQICRELTGEYVEIIDGDGNITILGDGNRWEIQTVDIADFPEAQSCDEGALTVDGGKLLSSIQWVSQAVDKKQIEVRFSFGGVLFEFSDNRLTLAGCDRNRMSVSSINDTSGGIELPSRECVVPYKSLKSIEGICEGQVTVSRSGSAIQFSSPCGKVWARFLGGRFAQWQQIVDVPDVYSFSITVGPLSKSLRQAAIVLNEDSSGCQFSFKDDNLTISGSGSDVGTSEVSIPVVINRGGEFTVNLDPRFLSEQLRTIDAASTIEWIAGSADAAQLIKSESDVCAVMPLVRD